MDSTNSSSTTSPINQISMEETVRKWKREHFKSKVDKSNNRHPVMSFIRTRSEEKLLSMFPTELKPPSIFDEKILNPTSFDIQFAYPFHMFMDKVKIKSEKIYVKFIELLKISISKYYNSKNKIDQLYEHQQIIDQNIHQFNQDGKYQDSRNNNYEIVNKNLKTTSFFSKIISIITFKSFRSKFKEKLEFDRKNDKNDKDIIKKILENENGFYYDLNIYKMRFKNSLCSALQVKKSYVLEVFLPKNKNPETIFYKVYKILQSNIYLYMNKHKSLERINAMSKKKRFFYLIFFGGVCFFTKTRYNNIGKTEMNEYTNMTATDRNERIEKLINDLNTNMNMNDTTSLIIFSREEDIKLLKVLRIEPDILNESIYYENYLNKKQEKLIQISRYFKNNTSNIDQIISNISSGMSWNLQLYREFAYYISLLSMFSYFVSNRKLNLKKRNLVGKSFLCGFVVYNVVYELFNFLGFLSYYNHLYTVRGTSLGLLDLDDKNEDVKAELPELELNLNTMSRLGRLTIFKELKNI